LNGTIKTLKKKKGEGMKPGAVQIGGGPEVKPWQRQDSVKSERKKQNP